MRVNAQACKPIINSSGFIDPCYPASFVNLSTSSGMVSYLWSTGSTLSSINVTAAGTYTVTVTYPGGCTGSSNFQVVNTDSYAINLQGSFTDCNTGQFNYQILNPLNGVTYYWTDLAGNNIGTGNSKAIWVNTSGSFTISYKNGTCQKTETFYIQTCCVEAPQNTYVDISTSQIGNGIQSAAFIAFNGTITVDNYFEINFCPNVVLGSGAIINVLPNCTLVIENSSLSGCQLMWKGIHVENGGFIRVGNQTVLEDAEIGIDLERSAHLEIQNTIQTGRNILRDNYIDIRANHGFLLQQFIATTDFDFSGTFLNPFPGQKLIPITRPYAAIVVNDLDIPVTFGKGVLAIDQLYIHDHACGFMIKNSDFNIINTRFQGIFKTSGYGTFTTNQNGFGVYVEANNNRSFSIQGLGTASTSPLTFSNCDGGILSKSSSFIVFNAIINANQIGIFNKLTQSPSTVRIFSNDINVTSVPNSGSTSNLSGINMNYTGTSAVLITGNEINVNQIGSGKPSRCIRMNDNMGANNKGVTITANDCRLIQQTKFGMEFINLLGSQVSDNYVFCNQGTISSTIREEFHRCYSSTNCSEIYFSHNQANTNTTVLQESSIGFYNFISPRWNYECNSAYQLNTGFEFDFNCMSAEKFTANYMGANYNGLFIDKATGAIGKQTHKGNRWGLINNIFLPPFGAAQLSGPPSSSEFDVHTNQIPANEFYPLFTNLTFNTILSGTPATCNLILRDAPADSIEILENVVENADTTDASDNGELGDYVLNRNVYRDLDNNAAMVNSSNMIENYYDSLSLTDIGYFEQSNKRYSTNQTQLNELILSRLINDSLLAAKATAYYNNCQQLIGGTLSTSDSLFIVQANSSLYIQMQALHSANDSLANAALWYNQNAATEAVNNNNIASGNTNYTANQKTVNAVYARTAAIGKTLSSADSLTIKNIAQQCLSYGGPAVLEARSLYSLVDANYSFSNIPCSMGSRWSLNDEGEVTAYSILVYPNPASEQININVPFNFIGDNTIQLMDLLGKVLIEKVMQKDVALSVSNIKSGLYFIQIKNELNGTIVSSKINILK